MVVPIRALATGAARIGGGDLDHRIEVSSGDEVQTLADSFNEMGARLKDSYATLEHKVADRTRELSEALDQLRALIGVSQAINSTFELQALLEAILSHACRLADAGGGAIYTFDEVHRGVHPCSHTWHEQRAHRYDTWSASAPERRQSGGTKRA